MSSNIDRWNQTIQYLQQSCNYVYEIDKIPNKYVLLMNMLCELLLEFDNGKEELICKKLEDIVSVHVPVPILIDTLFKILNKYPNNVNNIPRAMATTRKKETYTIKTTAARCK